MTGRAWLVFWLVGLASAANYYVFDSIGPVADLLQRQLGYTDTQIGLLNAVYSLPNVVLVLVGGMLVDRFGAGVMTLVTAAVCLVGAVLTAWAPGFEVMLLGRFLFGVGGETFSIAVFVAVVDYFPVGRLAFALGLSLGLGRAGSWSADMSPTWFADAYARGWQPPLVIAAVIAFLSLVAAAAYWLIDRTRATAASAPVHERMRVAELKQLGTAYWLMLALCILWYATMLAFRSTFAVKYFQHAHGLALDVASSLNGHVFLASIFATPLFGWLCDRTGRYAPFLAFSAVLLPVALLVMVSTEYIGIATVLIGVSYCMVPAVMWPLLSRLVPKHIFGTAVGLMWVTQNLGIAVANFAAGSLNDRASAGADNPAGYLPMMQFFIAMSVAGGAAALLLWRLAGQSRHERVATG